MRQAADRTPFVCQAQSLNLFVDPEIEAEELVRLHLSAWKNGVKSLYYLRSTSLVAKKDLSSPRAKIISKQDCPFCAKLKAQLKADGIAYHEIDRSVVEEFPYKTVPQLWLDGEHVGGYTDYMSRFHAAAGREEQQGECVACEG